MCFTAIAVIFLVFTAIAVFEVLMNEADLKKLIKSKEELFLKKLKYAGLNDLEYWEKRPENFWLNT